MSLKLLISYSETCFLVVQTFCASMWLLSTLFFNSICHALHIIAGIHLLCTLIALCTRNIFSSHVYILQFLHSCSVRTSRWFLFLPVQWITISMYYWQNNLWLIFIKVLFPVCAFHFAVQNACIICYILAIFNIL